MQQVFHRRFAAHSEQLKNIRDWVRATALASGMDSDKAERVVIGVNEACMNIIEHAYQQKAGDILLDILCDDDQLVIRLTDFAPTVDCSCIKPRALDDIRPGGLGVHFMQEVMDEVSYLPGEQGMGNIVLMKVRI